MITMITTAPEAYDYQSVQTLAFAKGKDGKTVRLIQVIDQKRFESHQLPRYESGFHTVFPAKSEKAEAVVGDTTALIKRGRVVLELREAHNRLSASVKHLNRATALTQSNGISLEDCPHQDVIDAAEALELTITTLQGEGI